MDSLVLHPFHQQARGVFFDFNGKEAVKNYDDPTAEYRALRESAGLLDLSFRGRLCFTGSDRQRFLNGQVTNNIKELKPGDGCYAALVTAKGKMQSDLNIYCLENELLLDFEPGLGAAIQSRLEKYIIAEDAQVLDVAPLYGMLSIQGPAAEAALDGLFPNRPAKTFGIAKIEHGELGEIYVSNQPRTGSRGFDVFIPVEQLPASIDKFLTTTQKAGGRLSGWSALETARIEAGIPRFGADMDETNLPPEAGLDHNAVSYSKGCYIGQEVIARIRTYGQVAKSLRGLRLADDLPALPCRGDKLRFNGKEAGYVTSAVASPALQGNIALAYVRREVKQAGTELVLQTAAGSFTAKVVDLPFC